MRGHLRFFKHMARVILFLFFVSMLTRVMGFILSFLLSPPVVLFFCLVSLIGPGWEQNFSGPGGFEDINRFQRRCFGPGARRRLRRFCGMGNICFGQNQEEQNHQNEAGGSNTDQIQDGETATSSSETSSTEECKKMRQNVAVHREETDDLLELFLDVPGFNANDISMSMERADLLRVGGERKNRLGDVFFVKESFTFDEEKYDLDNVTANLRDGVLEIKISKKPIPQPRMIPISTEKKSE